MKVVFVDRDGVINQFPGYGDYVKSWREFEFIPGSIEGLRKLKENGFKIFVASNQAGVKKGIYSKKALDTMTKKMRAVLKKNNADVDGVHYCLHTDDDNCLCRKPKKGLLDEAVESFEIKPNASFFIGDSFRDLEAARAFGAKGILVLSGQEKIASRDDWRFEPDYIFDNLLLAAHYLCRHYGK